MRISYSDLSPMPQAPFRNELTSETASHYSRIPGIPVTCRISDPDGPVAGKAGFLSLKALVDRQVRSASAPVNADGQAVFQAEVAWNVSLRRMCSSGTRGPRISALRSVRSGQRAVLHQRRKQSDREPLWPH